MDRRLIYPDDSGGSSIDFAGNFSLLTDSCYPERAFWQHCGNGSGEGLVVGKDNCQGQAVDPHTGNDMTGIGCPVSPEEDYEFVLDKGLA